MKLKSVYLQLLEDKKLVPNSKGLVAVENPDKIEYFVNPSECETFLKKYPKIKTAMLSFAKAKGKVRKRFVKFLDFLHKNEDKLGGEAKTLDSPTFGTKTFYHYDFPSGKTMFASVFQYLVMINE